MADSRELIEAREAYGRAEREFMEAFRGVEAAERLAEEANVRASEALKELDRVMAAEAFGALRKEPHT